VVESQSEMVCRFRADGTLLFVNIGYALMRGASPAELVGRSLWGVVHAADRDRVRAELTALTPGTPEVRIENRVETARGPCWIMWTNRALSFDAQGRWLEAQSVGVDITDRKRTEERLRAAHDTFHRLVDGSPFGIYVVNSAFRLVQVSDGAQKAFESVRPLIGRDFAEVMRAIWPEPAASAYIGHFRHTLATGEPYRAPNTIGRRTDIDAFEAYDWRIERIVLPDGEHGVVCHFYDLSERHAHEAKIHTLMREVSHRSKNLLALIQAVARQTAAQDLDDFLESFGARLQALASSQDLLMQADWEAADLGALIESQLLHFKDLVGQRICLRGPRIGIAPHAVQPLGMAMHELLTNAAKYGALSNETGHIEIAWDVGGEAEDAYLELTWRERNGPQVAAPTRQGFGARVLKSALEAALDAEVTLAHPESGLEWKLRCPLASLRRREVAPAIEAHTRGAGSRPAST
jgi:PAS domain S-box-containing protein